MEWFLYLNLVRRLVDFGQSKICCSAYLDTLQNSHRFEFTALIPCKKVSSSWCKGFLGFLEKYFVFMVQRIFWDFWKNNY
nr:uncharacterized protein LOC118879674 isoform X3 [Drosophila suzukii]